jgi:hypothetical protein
VRASLVKIATGAPVMADGFSIPSLEAIFNRIEKVRCGTILTTVFSFVAVVAGIGFFSKVALLDIFLPLTNVLHDMLVRALAVHMRLQFQLPFSLRLLAWLVAAGLSAGIILGFALAIFRSVRSLTAFLLQSVQLQGRIVNSLNENKDLTREIANEVVELRKRVEKLETQ